MTTDNLNGCTLTVLECRAVLAAVDIVIGITRSDHPYKHFMRQAKRKLEAGAAKETQVETRERTHEEI